MEQSFFPRALIASSTVPSFTIFWIFFLVLICFPFFFGGVEQQVSHWYHDNSSSSEADAFAFTIHFRFFTFAGHTLFILTITYKCIQSIPWIQRNFRHNMWMAWHNNLMLSCFSQRQTFRGILDDRSTFGGLNAQNLLKLNLIFGWLLLKRLYISLSDHNICRFWSFFWLSVLITTKSLIPGACLDIESIW